MGIDQTSGYANKQTAARAAKLEWEKIRERRDIIKENS